MKTLKFPPNNTFLLIGPFFDLYETLSQRCTKCCSVMLSGSSIRGGSKVVYLVFDVFTEGENQIWCSPAVPLFLLAMETRIGPYQLQVSVKLWQWADLVYSYLIGSSCLGSSNHHLPEAMTKPILLSICHHNIALLWSLLHKNIRYHIY